MATIQDIADRVGISKAAVSRILNHKGSFSRETIRKVEEAARELNYSSLSTYRLEEEDQKKIVAAIFPTYELPAFGYHVSMIEQAAHDFGFNLLLCGSFFDKEKEDEVFESLIKRKVSGVLLGSYSTNPTTLECTDLPIVTIGYKASDNISSVRSDDYSAGRLAAKHLLSKGCSKPVYINSYTGDLENDLRGKGFHDELSRYGITPWNYHVDIDMQIAHDFTSVISMIPLEHPDADCMFTETEILGMSCLQTYLSLGYRVPEDIRIVGFGSSFYSRYTYPQLTLIHENTEMIARKAVEALSRKIEAEGSIPPEHILTPVSLIEKKTT